MARQTVLDFIAAINAHDIEKIISLMTEDHIFIDCHGNRQNKNEMRIGWLGYFSWFPDYRIEIEEMLVLGRTVGIFGFASATYNTQDVLPDQNHWRLPAAWKAAVENNKIKLWQVYADSKIPFAIMNRSGK